MLKDLFVRLSRNWKWIAGQFIGTALLILIGLAWTRVPEKHWWQVALTLLIPILLAISILELQAGTIRAFADDDGKRVKLVWGAMTLVFWVAVVWVCWWALDWCDDRIWDWASYLNSKAPAGQRATLFTFAHLTLWMKILEWIFRWIAIPAKVTAWAGASAQWGWRLPVRRIIRMLWNWRWWLGVTLAALLGVLLPSRFFSGNPHGTVAAQEWSVGLKLTAAYLLAMTAWVLVLGWFAVLFPKLAEPPREEALVAVPVLAGPPDKELLAKAIPEKEGGPEK